MRSWVIWSSDRPVTALSPFILSLWCSTGLWTLRSWAAFPTMKRFVFRSFFHSSFIHFKPKKSVRPSIHMTHLWIGRMLLHGYSVLSSSGQWWKIDVHLEASRLLEHRLILIEIFVSPPQAFFTETYMKNNPEHLERIEVLKHLIALQVTLCLRSVFCLQVHACISKHPHRDHC